MKLRLIWTNLFRSCLKQKCYSDTQNCDSSENIVQEQFFMQTTLTQIDASRLE